MSGTAHVLAETTAPRRKAVGSSPYIGLAEGADHGLEGLGLRAVAGLVVALALRHEDRELCFGQGHVAGACMATWSASCAVAAVHPPSSPTYPAVRAPRRRGGPPPCRPWLDLCRPHVVGLATRQSIHQPRSSTPPNHACTWTLPAVCATGVGLAGRVSWRSPRQLVAGSGLFLALSSTPARVRLSKTCLNLATWSDDVI